MNDRLQYLAGKNPRQESIDVLSAHKKQIVEECEKAIYAVKNGAQIDEGFFNSLKIALDTALNMGSAGTKAVKQKVSTMATSVKEVYKSAKAKAELQNIVDFVQKNIKAFDQLVDKSQTIMKVDKEINKEMLLFKQLFANLINTLGARQAVSEGVENDAAAMQYMLVDMGFIDEPAMTLEEAAATPVMSMIKGTPEFEEASKRMKFVSSSTQLKNGTLVFDTGMAGLKFDGSEDPKTSYLLKVYSDGQVRAELKNGKNLAGIPSPHYRLGKPIVGKDQAEVYRKSLVNIVQRFEKKTARYGKEKEILAKKHAEWQEMLMSANVDKDATPED